MKFAAFLLENKHKESISLEEAIYIVQTKCKKSIHNKIWRGGGFEDGIYLMDSSKTVRRSANTANHYTLILDHINNKKDLPLRSKSFIMSGSQDIAEQFGTCLRIIPFDDAKIGLTGEEDFWYVQLNTDDDLDFEYFGALFSNLKISNKSYEELVDSCVKKLIILRENAKTDDVDQNDEQFLNIFKDFNADKNGIEKALEKAFDCGLQYCTGATAIGKTKTNELWLSGKCLAVTDEIYDEIKKALN